MNQEKEELVHSWLTKAQHDLASARKLATEPDAYLDTAIYHCQQAAEKAVKGFLVFCDQPFDKIHDVGSLVNLAVPFNESFSAWQNAASSLTPYATAFRYPGIQLEPSRAEFEQAFQAAEGFYSFVLSLLPPGVHPR